MLRWCERHEVKYLVGLAKNTRLLTLSESLMKSAAAQYGLKQEKARLFAWVDYGAGTWDRQRRVIIKAEHGAKGSNPRFVVTNLEGDAQQLYDHVYCARGEMENRIKEQQLGLFADRTSCHSWLARPPASLFPSSSSVGQSVAVAALGGRLRADGNDPPCRPLWHRTGASAGHHHPLEAVENWHRDHPQHPADPALVFERLSLPGTLRQNVSPA